MHASRRLADLAPGVPATIGSLAAEQGLKPGQTVQVLRRASWSGPLHIRLGMTTVALLGMPNTGQWTLFKRLTGSHAQIGNWPGRVVAG